ncbi:hypothetical protein MHU86_13442 [Fragilaria crotonensis]|nr:hypothetical protein MHU86_13442 [Fragilaria crotonensis]
MLNLNHIVRELEAAKVNNDGKIPYGAITSMVRKMTHLLPWLTKDMIQHQLRKRNGMMNDLVDGDDEYNNGGSGQNGTSLPGSSMSNTDGGTLSTLTHESAADSTKDNMTEPPQAQNYKPLDHHITTALPLGLVHHHARDNEEEEDNSEFMVEGEKTTAGEKTATTQLQHPPVEIWLGE